MPLARSSLGLGRKAEERVDLAIDEQLLGADRAAGDPVGLRPGVDDDIADDHGQEQVFRRSHRRDADFLAVEVSDAADLGEGLGLLLSDPLLGEALPSPAAVTYRSRSAGSLIRPQDARSLGGRDGQPFRQDRAYRSSDAGKPVF